MGVPHGAMRDGDTRWRWRRGAGDATCAVA